jgi:hypothetical protein
MTRRTLLVGALSATTLAAAPGAAGASQLLGGSVATTGTAARACQLAPAAGAPGVVTRTVTMPALGVVSARLSGSRADWDLAVFDAKTRRLVGASAAPGTSELAQGFAFAGRELLVQACRRDAVAGAATLTVSAREMGRDTEAYRLKLVEVAAPTDAVKRRVQALDLDLTEHGGDGTLQLVLHSSAEEARLRQAGFTPRVVIADLVTQAAKNAAKTLRYRASTSRSALPSGRTDYRHLADYESEMKQLAQQNPGLVKLIELPNKSLEGRTILGLEIAKDVNVADGRPTFVQAGVHHAREWPSGEHAMEYAYDLIRGFGKDERITKIVTQGRTVVVPIVNVDGFNLSREAPVDLGTPAAMANLPTEVNQQLPIEDPAYTAALLADQASGSFAYKRRNCRVKDGAAPSEGECGTMASRTLGTDPNRNYGALWGGPGADFSPTSDIYRGASPFSEPETQNIQALVSTRQATALITNHTFSNLILRPPGVRAQGVPVDEKPLKALSDAMAAQNGYASIPGYQLYDTTGTTEDWSYAATGGFGYTFEIGSEQFHPPFPQVVGEYEGAGQFAGKGNRGAYLLAAEASIDAAQHSVLTGRAPKGTTLRVKKEFASQTSPVLQDAEGRTGPPISFPDRVESLLEVGDAGTFTWHVNPSTRPQLAKARTSSEVADTPASELDISSPTPVLPTQPKLVEFMVPADATRQFRASISSAVPIDDYDLYLYEDQFGPNNLSGSSASAEAEEVIVFDNPVPGRKYILEIRNFTAVGPVDGKIQFLAEKPGTQMTVPAQKEAYTLTCEKPAGTVLTTQKVTVDRGQKLALGDVCAKGQAAGRSPLKLSLGIDKRRLDRALAGGLRTRARCSVRCTVRVLLTLDGKTSKRLGLSRTARTTVVATTATKKNLVGRRAFTLKFTAKGKTALRRIGRGRTVRFRALVTATDAQKRKVSRSRVLVLRR